VTWPWCPRSPTWWLRPLVALADPTTTWDESCTPGWSSRATSSASHAHASFRPRWVNTKKGSVHAALPFCSLSLCRSSASWREKNIIMHVEWVCVVRGAPPLCFTPCLCFHRRRWRRLLFALSSVGVVNELSNHYYYACTYYDDKLYAHALRQTALFLPFNLHSPGLSISCTDIERAAQQLLAGMLVYGKTWGKKWPRSNKVALPFSFELAESAKELNELHHITQIAELHLSK
jgi:hypothetical protein